MTIEKESTVEFVGILLQISVLAKKKKRKKDESIVLINVIDIEKEISWFIWFYMTNLIVSFNEKNI